jgi:hypothetical protein
MEGSLTPAKISRYYYFMTYRIIIVHDSTILKNKSIAHSGLMLYFNLRGIRKGLMFTCGLGNIICHIDTFKMIILHNIRERLGHQKCCFEEVHPRLVPIMD